MPDTTEKAATGMPVTQADVRAADGENKAKERFDNLEKQRQDAEAEEQKRIELNKAQS